MSRIDDKVLQADTFGFIPIEEPGIFESKQEFLDRNDITMSVYFRFSDGFKNMDLEKYFQGDLDSITMCDPVIQIAASLQVCQKWGFMPTHIPMIKVSHDVRTKNKQIIPQNSVGSMKHLKYATFSISLPFISVADADTELKSVNHGAHELFHALRDPIRLWPHPGFWYLTDEKHAPEKGFEETITFLTEYSQENEAKGFEKTLKDLKGYFPSRKLPSLAALSMASLVTIYFGPLAAIGGAIFSLREMTRKRLNVHYARNGSRLVANAFNKLTEFYGSDIAHIITGRLSYYDGLAMQPRLNSKDDMDNYMEQKIKEGSLKYEIFQHHIKNETSLETSFIGKKESGQRVAQ